MLELDIYTVLIIGLVFVGLGVAVVLFINFRGINTSKLNEAEINSRINDFFQEDGTSNIMNNYYLEILKQSKLSYIFSFVGAIAGLLIIVMLLFFKEYMADDSEVFSAVSAAVLEAISLLFFARSNKAEKNMRAYFDTLLVDKISNTEKKDNLIAKMIESSIYRKIFKSK